MTTKKQVLTAREHYWRQIIKINEGNKLESLIYLMRDIKRGRMLFEREINERITAFQKFLKSPKSTLSTGVKDV